MHDLVESISNLLNKLSTIQSLTEGKGHMDHPEDLVLLQGSAGATKALKAMTDTISNPAAVTIKWDGYPALIWGYGNDGKFSVMDKHMFNKGVSSPARSIHSPQEFIKYDRDRGVERAGLAELMPKIWNELQQLTPKKKGYFWGDLLFTSALKPQKDGMYHFQANPKGIKYTVQANTAIGQKYFKDKQAGIVVHQFLDVNADNTDDSNAKHSLNGSTGGMGEGKYLSILPAAMPQTPNLKINKKLYDTAQNAVREYGPGMDKFFNDSPKTKSKSGIDKSTLHELFTMYINEKVRQRNLSNLVAGFIPFVEARASSNKLSKRMALSLLGFTDPTTGKKTDGYLTKNIKGIEDVFKVWIAVYNFKMSLISQLDKAAETAPIQGYLNDGSKSHEGFVSHDIKLVNRLGFAAQNLSGQ